MACPCAGWHRGVFVSPSLRVTYPDHGVVAERAFFKKD